MKTAVVVLQHENWEDDGGDHDPRLVTIADPDFAFLASLAETDDADARIAERSEMDRVRAILAAAATPGLPCQLDAVFNIWFS